MEINYNIFRNYDIRGIVDKDLDTEIVEKIAMAYGTFLRKRKIRHAVVGCDCRLSGSAYKTSMIKGMRSVGINIIDLGTVMTQMMYFAQYRYQTNGGVMITASHNPSNYNGMKLAIGYSQTTGREEIQEIRKIIEQENYFRSDKECYYEQKNVTKDYINDLLKRIVLEKKIKVVVDTGCGTAGLYVPEIFKKAGCEVIEKNTKVDGNFPVGTPDPTSKTMADRVTKTVLNQKADLGISFDGDGDRIGLVDEVGDILWNDVLVAIFAKEILERFPGAKIVYNTLCSQVVKEVINANGGIPIMWKTGHSFIKAKVAEEKAVFGGELSGHFFFADNFYGHDDGAYAALRILEYLSEKGQTLSQLYESFPRLISSPEIKIGCPDDKKINVIEDLSIKFKKDFPDVEITDKSIIPGDDGVRADFNDGMIIFRYSQNGPYITIKFEAKDQIQYDKRKNYIRNLLEDYPDMIWEDELCVNLESLA
jgi:phosphomannomutase/phosphoglucomutase